MSLNFERGKSANQMTFMASVIEIRWPDEPISWVVPTNKHIYISDLELGWWAPLPPSAGDTLQVLPPGTQKNSPSLFYFPNLSTFMNSISKVKLLSTFNVTWAKVRSDMHLWHGWGANIFPFTFCLIRVLISAWVFDLTSTSGPTWLYFSCHYPLWTLEYCLFAICRNFSSLLVPLLAFFSELVFPLYF